MVKFIKSLIFMFWIWQHYITMLFSCVSVSIQQNTLSIMNVGRKKRPQNVRFFEHEGEISIWGQHLNHSMNYSWGFCQLFYHRLIIAHGTQAQPSHGTTTDKSSRNQTQSSVFTSSEQLQGPNGPFGFPFTPPIGV